MAAASVPQQPKCDAPNKQGRSCGLHAGWGTDHPGYGHCKYHFGNTTNGRTHAARLRVAALVNPEPTTGVAAIERGLALQNGLVTALENEVTELGLIVGGHLNPLVRTLTDELRALVQIGKLASEAKVDERRLELDEQHAQLIAQVLRGTLAVLDLTPEQHALARAETRRQFALVQGAAA